MVEIKEILKEKVFKDIKNGDERMSEETVEFIKKNFYMCFGAELDRIYDMFKVVYSFSNRKTPFSIKASKEFLFGHRRQFIASNVFNYLDFMNYNEVLDNFIKANGKDFFNNLDNVKEEVVFIYDPSSKVVNTENIRLDLTDEERDE